MQKLFGLARLLQPGSRFISNLLRDFHCHRFRLKYKRIFKITLLFL